MSTDHLTPEQLERLAHRRAGAKLSWYIHAFVYLCVNAFLISLSLWQGRHWAMFPLLGWGLGLALHGFVVFVLGPGNAVRERLIANERAKLERRQNAW